MTASGKRVHPFWKAMPGAMLRFSGVCCAIVLPPLTIRWLISATDLVIDGPSFYGGLLFAMATGLPGLLISTTKKSTRYILLGAYMIIGGPCLFAYAMLLIAIRMRGG